MRLWRHPKCRRNWAEIILKNKADNIILVELKLRSNLKWRNEAIFLTDKDGGSSGACAKRILYDVNIVKLNVLVSLNVSFKCFSSQRMDGTG